MNQSRKAQRKAEAIQRARRNAMITRLPQTVWITNDRDAPYTSAWNGKTIKAELKPRPVITVLPENYFA